MAIYVIEVVHKISFFFKPIALQDKIRAELALIIAQEYLLPTVFLILFSNSIVFFPLVKFLDNYIFFTIL